MPDTRQLVCGRCGCSFQHSASRGMLPKFCKDCCGDSRSGTCKGCGEVIYRRFHVPEYCSTECRRKHKYRKPCALCGADTDTRCKSGKRVFCCKEHWIEYQRKHGREVHAGNSRAENWDEAIRYEMRRSRVNSTLLAKDEWWKKCARAASISRRRVIESKRSLGFQSRSDQGWEHAIDRVSANLRTRANRAIADEWDKRCKQAEQSWDRRCRRCDKVRTSNTTEEAAI